MSLIEVHEPVITPGTPVELTCTFTNAEGQPTEPSAVRLELLEPSQSRFSPGVVKTVVPSKKATAAWHYNFTPTRPGRWWFRWEGEGVASTEGTFPVAQEVA